MELKAGFEDIENGPRKVEKNEENWIKRVKIKFKAGGNFWIDSEEDEKKMKVVKEKNSEQSKGKDNKMIKKRGNNKDGRESEGKTVGTKEEEENKRWQASKGKKGKSPPKEKGINKKNSNINEEGWNEKYVAGKVRIVDSLDGPTPKLIEDGNGGKKKGKTERKKGLKGKGKNQDNKADWSTKNRMARGKVGTSRVGMRTELVMATQLEEAVLSQSFNWGSIGPERIIGMRKTPGLLSTQVDEIEKNIPRLGDPNEGEGGELEGYEEGGDRGNDSVLKLEVFEEPVTKAKLAWQEGRTRG